MKYAAQVTLGLMSVLFISNAYAMVQITKTYNFPIEKYEALERAISEADARTDKATTVFTKQLDAGDRSSIRCSEESPQVLPKNNMGQSGWGCVLTFATDLGNGVLMENSQMVLLEKSAADIRKMLSDSDARQKSTLELPGLFDGGQGSRYYCDSIGGAWNCKLRFVSGN